MTGLIEKLEWQIKTMRAIPSNRISDRVLVNAGDIEALIESLKAATALENLDNPYGAIARGLR